MAINTTPNLHLPQWTPNEKPSYLVDFNQAFAAIDTGFSGVKDGSDRAVQIATNAYNQAAGALQTANQTQNALNGVIEKMRTKAVNITTAPSENIADMTSTLYYNDAIALLVIDMGSRDSTTSKTIGTITIPSNITLLGINYRMELTNVITPSWVEQIMLTTTDGHIVNVRTVIENVHPSWRFGIVIPLIAVSHEGRSTEDLIYRAI